MNHLQSEIRESSLTENMEESETAKEISVTDESTGEENYVTLSFSHNDPLGLNDLTQAQVPTYNYSLDDGLHNFVIPVSSNNSQQFVVASNSFSLAPLVQVQNSQQSKFFSYFMRNF